MSISSFHDCLACRLHSFEERIDVKVLDVNGERFKISGLDLLVVADVKNKHSCTLQVSDLAIIGGDWRDMEQFS